MKKILGSISAFWAGVNFDTFMMEQDWHYVIYMLFYLSLAIYFLYIKSEGISTNHVK